MRNVRFILIFVLAMLSCTNLYAQLSKPDQTISPNATLVYLESCDRLTYDQDNHPGAQLLTGNVQFRHDSALMFCDSAYFYEANNSVDAYGNIRFEQGDTLFGYGDILYYNGNTRLARLRNNVRLVHFSTVLTTDSLNYNRNEDIAYYFDGGNINDSLNTLTSVWGQYEPPTNQATFKGAVKLNNQNFTLESDTLLYNTASHIADIVSPTTIVYQEETNIFSDKGWYNTSTEESMLLNRSRVEHTDGKQLTGDTIFYDKRAGIGRIFSHMEITDTVNNLTLYGNYGEYHENDQSGFATDSALAVDRSDSLWLYIHADTLFTEPETISIITLIPNDSIIIDSVLTAVAPDTMRHDSSFQRMRAYRSVRVYRDDMQAVCDSMSYTAKDSLMHFYYDPIAWNDSNQLSADSIIAQMANGTVDHVHCYGSAIAVKQESDDYFDQLSGKEMIAFVRNGELRQINVDGNAETVFFPREDKKGNEQGAIVGVNKTQSSYVKLYITNNKIERVVFTTRTTGTTYPLDELSPEQMLLSPFFWAFDVRPFSPDDVFRHSHSPKRPKAGAQRASTDAESATNKSDKKTNSTTTTKTNTTSNSNSQTTNKTTNTNKRSGSRTDKVAQAAASNSSIQKATPLKRNK